MHSKPSLLDRLADAIAARLTRPSSGCKPYAPTDSEALLRVLQPGDIVLVEGDQKVSTAIKYLTQSTWSHAAIFVGDALPIPAEGGERPQLIEVNLGEGCVAVPLSKYHCYNTRICRAHGLNSDELEQIVQFMVNKLGLRYDMRNIIDLARYLFPTPPVPVRWRRKMLALGSGDPTRAICSSLITQAYQSVRYPILPNIETLTLWLDDASAQYVRKELLHIRHHSLFVPRDFDLSPFFSVIKPTIEEGFDFRKLTWAETTTTQ